MTKKLKLPPPPAPPTRRLLTRRQAAEYLGVAPGTLSRWAADRIGPTFVKLSEEKNAGVRYPLDLLEQYVADRMKHAK